jgi:phosphoserine aminotransferase
MLPLPILLEAQKELLNWKNLGMSVMEVGHRSVYIVELMDELRELFVELLAIPNDYQVLFLPFPARMQFAMIPMNFMSPKYQALYLVSGVWSQMAFEEASKIGSATSISSAEGDAFTSSPIIAKSSIAQDTSYVFYTPNETINGVRYQATPDVGEIPLVADMSSCILGEPMNVSDFDLVFAGAQKNISLPGLTIVFVKSSFLQQSKSKNLPIMLDFNTYVEHQSLYATPPVFSLYMAKKMLLWLKSNGGLTAFYQENIIKASRLYEYIDSSSLYFCKVKPNSRSFMNVCFSLYREELIPAFISGAEKYGLCSLKGHRIVGGLRASLYNSMPIDGVMALIQFMRDFAKEHQ